MSSGGRLRFRSRELGQSKIENLHPTTAGQEEVLGFDVAVHDPMGVSLGEALGNLDPVFDPLAQGDRTAGKPLPKRLPLEKLRDEVRCTFVGAYVVNRKQIGMVELSGGAGFLLEAP